MTTIEFLLLQFVSALALIWLCWIVYPHWCNYWYGKLGQDDRDEHTDIDNARG